MITSLLPYLQTFLAIGNLCIMLWAFKTFLAKPHDTLETRVRELEKRVDGNDVKKALKLEGSPIIKKYLDVALDAVLGGFTPNKKAKIIKYLKGIKVDE